MRRLPLNDYERRLALYAAIPRAAEARGYSMHDVTEWYYERYTVPVTALTIAQLEAMFLFFGGSVQRPLFHPQATGGAR